MNLKPSRKQIQHGDKAAAVSVLRLGQIRKNFRDFPCCEQGVQVLFYFGWGQGAGFGYEYHLEFDNRSGECVRYFRNVILNALLIF